MHIVQFVWSHCIKFLGARKMLLPPQQFGSYELNARTKTAIAIIVTTAQYRKQKPHNKTAIAIIVTTAQYRVH